MSNSEKINLKSTETIISGYISSVRYSSKISIENNDNDFDEFNNNDNIYTIIIGVIDKKNDFKKYNLVGSSTTCPKVNDVVSCKKCHIEISKQYSEQYQYHYQQTRIIFMIE